MKVDEIVSILSKFKLEGEKAIVIGTARGLGKATVNEQRRSGGCY